MKSLIRSFIFSEKRLAGAIFGVLALVAFSFIFGPNIYAQFARQTGGSDWGYGYGYGYGYGSGFDHGTYAGYRTTGGSPTSDIYGYGYGYMASGVTHDPVTGYSVTPDDLGSLVQSGIAIPNGAGTGIAFQDKVTLTAAGLDATITIPNGTTFTAATPNDFSDLAAAAADTADLTGATVAGALSFGLPNLGLTVNPAITIAVNVGPTYEGQVLIILRKDAGGSWVYGPDGTNPTCTVVGGICTITTTQLSSFAVASNAGGDNGGDNGGGGGGGGGGAGTYTPATTDSTVAGTYNTTTAMANNPDINTDKSLPAATVTPACVSGALIKSASLPAVYYCGKDGKRYVFVNDKAYFSWYANFSSVQIVSDATLATITIGGNITYRPGVRMIKIQSDPKVYAIARGGTLRWVGTEAIAARLYGANWNQQIDDVSDAFFVNYHVGTSITQ